MIQRDIPLQVNSPDINASRSKLLEETTSQSLAGTQNIANNS